MFRIWPILCYWWRNIHVIKIYLKKLTLRNRSKKLLYCGFRWNIWKFSKLKKTSVGILWKAVAFQDYHHIGYCINYAFIIIVGIVIIYTKSMRNVYYNAFGFIAKWTLNPCLTFIFH